MERNFKIGDRVRIIGCRAYSGHVGKETVIVAYSPPDDNTTLRGCWFVDLPTLAGTKCGLALYAPEHLEPLYDGNEIAAWSDCVWQPTKLTA